MGGVGGQFFRNLIDPVSLAKTVTSLLKYQGSLCPTPLVVGWPVEETAGISDYKLSSCLCYFCNLFIAVIVFSVGL